MNGDGGIPDMELPSDEALLSAIKAAIEAAGGVTAAAKATGIPIGTLNKYVAGTSMPSFSNAAKIADAAGVSLDALSGMRSIAAQRPYDEWLMNELGKIVVHEHRAARATLPAEKVAPEAGALYNELLGMVQDATDRRTVEAMLPLLAENLRERLREAAVAPGTGKREVS